jgi:hypothetical protein
LVRLVEVQYFGMCLVIYVLGSLQIVWILACVCSFWFWQLRMMEIGTCMSREFVRVVVAVARRVVVTRASDGSQGAG